jgi:hypothetical protein
MLETIRNFLSTSFVMKVRLKYEVFRWSLILREKNSTVSQVSRPLNILFATNIGENLNALALDITLARKLKQRGHKITFSLCDKSLPACMNCEINKFSSLNEFVENGSKKLCHSCVKTGTSVLTNAGLEIQYLKITTKKTPDSDQSHLENATAGALRFLAIGSADREKRFSEVLSRYIQASIISEAALLEIMIKKKIDLVIAHHGIYVPQGNVVSVARKNNIQVITWSQAYRKKCYIFARNDTYHKTLLQLENWHRELSDLECKQTQEYLASRDVGDNDWIRFGKVNSNQSKNLPFDLMSRPTALLLTNVSWDAQIHYDSRIFSDMHEWIRETIYFFIKEPEVNLIIRIHPAEVTGRVKSRDMVYEWLISQFPNLPENIHVIRPEDSISTYSLFSRVNLGIVFATKAGVELAASGLPVIVAGESWIRNKGFTIDPSNRDEYLRTLLAFKEDSKSLFTNPKRALEFAHFFFFRLMIPISGIRQISHYPYARPATLAKNATRDPGLDYLINCIENNSDIYLP